ncbi:MAG TPA: histidine kinase dimerization/phospho-acceptor domain-containing protein, partial [Pirellulales bacterium]|nr:histidine kinase dimerization/phospho-acceptor domain-containing protein [Pirellulales bacterium]
MINSRYANMMQAHWAWTVVLVGLAGLWLAGVGVQQPSFAVRAGVLLSAIGVAGGLVVLERRAVRRRETEICRHLEALCELEYSSVAVENSDIHDTLPPDSPFHGPLARLRSILTSQASRLADSEQARASLEARCRRAVSDQQRLADIVARIPEPIVAVDQYDDLVLANRSAEELLAFEESRQTAGRALAKLDRCQRLIALLGDTRKRKLHAPRSEDLEIEDAKGRRRWFNVTLTSLRPEHGTNACEGVVAVMRDISRQRQMQKQHAEFVTSASHEMKAPLAGIKAYVELLADAKDEVTREEFLEVINGQTDRLQRLIDNLLNVARIEAGVVKVNKQLRALNDVLVEAMHVVQPLAEAKQIALHSDLSPLYLGVLVDRDMILQAAINLLSNAVKYTPPGGSVRLHSHLAGDD